MLREIQLVNFEPHEDTELEFDPGLNVICGSSDSGKSSLIRAMKWVGLNSMRGDGFIRNGESRAEVTLVTDDDDTVTRVRSSSVNSYSVNGGTPLKGFSSNLPEGVEETLKLSEINFQSQLEPHFLMSATGGETGKFLNRIVSLDEIDGVLTAVESERRRNARAVEEKEEEISGLRDELNGYRDLDEALRDFAKLLEIENELSEAEEYLSKLTPIRERLAGLGPKIARLSNAGDAAGDTVSMVEGVKLWKQAIQRRDRLTDLAGSMDRVRDGLSSVQGIPEASSELKSIQALSDHISRKRSRLKELSQWQRSMKDLQDRVYRAESKKESAERDLLDQIDELPEQCPYCGAAINRETLV